eukprot:Mrub_09184.p4 GENE.Mrub_09184~~Mrub_09184.p4  ORF type:complete len:103 (-),score=6.98 Mrub_09184:124-432(-)
MQWWSYPIEHWSQMGQCLTRAGSGAFRSSHSFSLEVRLDVSKHLPQYLSEVKIILSAGNILCRSSKSKDLVCLVLLLYYIHREKNDRDNIRNINNIYLLKYS